MWILWHTCHMWRVYVTFDLIVSAFLSLGFVVASLLRLKVDEADWDGLTGTPNFHVLCQEIQNVELVSSPRSLNRYRVAKYMTTASLISECVQICSMPSSSADFADFFNIRIINPNPAFLGTCFGPAMRSAYLGVANLFQNLFGRRHHRIFEGCSKWIEMIGLHFFKPATFNPSCVKHSAASSLPTCGPPWENRNEGSIDSILSWAMARKSTGSSTKAWKLRDGNGIDPVDIIQPLSQLLGFVDKPTRPTSKSRGLLLSNCEEHGQFVAILSKVTRYSNIQ